MDHSWPGAGAPRGDPVGQVGEERVELGPGARGLGERGAPFVLAGVQPAGVPVGVEGGHRRVPLGGADAHGGKDAAGAGLVLALAHPAILPPPARAAGEVRRIHGARPVSADRDALAAAGRR